MVIDALPKALQELRITSEAYQKVVSYARIVGDTECSGFLLTRTQSNDGVTRDVCLASGQLVGACHVEIPKLLSALGGVAIKGWKPEGVWHSHGEYSVFHSHLDDCALREVYNALSGLSCKNSWRINLEREQINHKTRRKGKGLELILRELNPINLYFSAPSRKAARQLESLIRACRLELRDYLGVCYAKSLVVNRHSSGSLKGKDYYAELLCQSAPYSPDIVVVRNAPVCLLDEDNGIELSEAALREQVEASLRYK